MRKRNNIFAAAFDYLKREKGIKRQKQLAQLMGVSEDTITRILKDRCEVTEDIITKLQTASGCIFNLQWLRGEDETHMLAVDMTEDIKEKNTPQSVIDQSSLINVALSSQMEEITHLKQTIQDMNEQHLRELATKDEVIKEKNARIADLEKLSEERLHRIADLRRELDVHLYGNLPFPPGVADKPNDRKTHVNK